MMFQIQQDEDPMQLLFKKPKKLFRFLLKINISGIYELKALPLSHAHMKIKIKLYTY